MYNKEARDRFSVPNILFYSFMFTKFLLNIILLFKSMVCVPCKGSSKDVGYQPLPYLFIQFTLLINIRYK